MRTPCAQNCNGIIHKKCQIVNKIKNEGPPAKIRMEAPRGGESEISYLPEVFPRANYGLDFLRGFGIRDSFSSFESFLICASRTCASLREAQAS